jgi:hypothetical protein
LPKSPSEIIIHGDYATVSLTKGYVAIIDASDVPLVSGYKWFMHSRAGKFIYAIRHKPGTRNGQISMHREILGISNDPLVYGDHIDGSTLDNRRKNLRIASGAQNRRNRAISRNNSSGTSGVYLDRWKSKPQGKWTAFIHVDGKDIKKRFQTKEHAIAARLVMEKEYFGAFARDGQA